MEGVRAQLLPRLHLVKGLGCTSILVLEPGSAEELC